LLFQSTSSYQMIVSASRFAMSSTRRIRAGFADAEDTAARHSRYSIGESLVGHLRPLWLWGCSGAHLEFEERTPSAALQPAHPLLQHRVDHMSVQFLQSHRLRVLELLRVVKSLPSPRWPP
jgi:hypothetical protein